MDQSYSDRSRFFLDQSIASEDGGTLVGLESPTGPQIAGGTPTLDLDSGHSKLYTRYSRRKPFNEPMEFSPMVTS